MLGCWVLGTLIDMSLALDDYPYRMSFEEFLVFEDGSDFRHEFFDGVVYAMAGGTLVHNQIAVAFMSRLLTATVVSACRVSINDVPLKTATRSFYPDVMVACAEVVHDRYETSPCLVVEVTSPSTERIDRTTKHATYTSIDTVLAYCSG